MLKIYFNKTIVGMLNFDFKKLKDIQHENFIAFHFIQFRINIKY
jgi:hypothetical protein